GTTGRYDHRPTDADPSLSGLQGMLAAAAGIGQNQPLPHWITRLHLAVRVDQPGVHLTDYHTVNQPPSRRYRHLTEQDQKGVFTVAQEQRDRKGRPLRKNMTVVSMRGYRADTTYLIAIADHTGDVTATLTSPSWALYAGRKSCPLTEPFLLGHTTDRPETALGTVPTVDPKAGDGPVARRAVLFADPGDATRTEDRNDRLIGSRRHRIQRRWHTTVTCPTAADWFDIMDLLKDAA
ncbi:MAG: type I-E CRISPR-associated protein Cas5/CasD, partial [Acidimicrobiia bacterium]